MDTNKTCTKAEDVTGINRGEQNNQGRSEVQATAPPIWKKHRGGEWDPEGRGLIGQYHMAQIRSGRPLSADIRESVTCTMYARQAESHRYSSPVGSLIEVEAE